MSELTDRLRRYYQTDKFDPNDTFDSIDFVNVFGTAEEVLLYQKLFFPTLVERHGAIFAEEWLGNEERLETWLMEANGAPARLSEIEWNWNFLDILYLLDCNEPNFQTEEEWLYLADKLVRAWQIWFAGCFPERRFVFKVYSQQETGDEIEIRFWCDRDTEWGFLPQEDRRERLYQSER